MTTLQANFLALTRNAVQDSLVDGYRIVLGCLSMSDGRLEFKNQKRTGRGHRDWIYRRW